MTEEDSTREEHATEESPEDSSLPNALALRGAVLELLAHHEDQFLLLTAEDDTETPVPEFLEEQKLRLREDLYEALRHLFMSTESPNGQLGVAYYEKVVFSLAHERLRKTLAYYQALNRFQEEVRKTNQELGDPKGIEVPLHDMQKLLLGLDEVDFVRRLGTSMGVFQDDLDKIVEHMIVREFAPMRRRELPHPRGED